MKLFRRYVHRVIQELFAEGIEPESYTQGLRNYRKLVTDLYAEVVPDEQWATLFSSAVAAAGERTFMTVMTEDWCGDSACNVPLLTRLASGANLPFRVFRGSDFPTLKSYYNDRNVTHIPVVSIWDSQERELFRWIERPAACAAPADAWKAAHPDFSVLHKGTDKESQKGFARLYREFLEEMSRWYRDGLWAETARELAQGLQAALS